MKNLFLVSCILLLMVSKGVAQEDDSRTKLAIGARAGMNVSNIYDSQGGDLEADAKLGFTGGAFLSVPIGKYIGIQPELLFSQRGYRGSGTMLTFRYDYTRTSSYLDLPVLFSFKPVKVLNILAGPQFSYLLKQKDTFTSSLLTIEQEQEFENSNVRKNTLCFLGGVDVNLSRFVVGGRVGWDILHNNGDGTTSDPRYRNIWYQLTVGFRFY